MLINRHNMTKRPIQYVGRNWTPADGGVNSANPVAVAPPSGIIAGDLVLLFCSSRANGSVQTITTDGGQSWTSAGQLNSGQQATQIYWCTFNGTWTGNPAFSASLGTSAISIGIVAFRPSTPGKTWGVDVSMSVSTSTAYNSVGAVPTVPGQTTTREKTVSIAMINNNAGTTYSSPTPDWGDLGRFLNNGQLNITVAYKTKINSGPTGNFQRTVVTLPSGGNNGLAMVTFYES